jgi:drug/metabolite transporter (DMT)-like permease
MKIPQHYRAETALVTAMILWATSFVALKIAFRGYDPMFVMFGRQLAAALLFMPIFARLRSRMTIRKKDIPLLLLMAFFEPCLYFVFEAAALSRTSASQAGMITSILPLTVAIAAFFILKEKLTVRIVAGFAVAIAGAFLLSVFSDSSSSAPSPALGNFLEFLAMVCATGYTITLKRLSSRYDPFYLTAVQCFTGTVFFFPIVLFTGGFPTSLQPVSAGAILYLGVVVSMGAYGLYNYGISKVDASRGAAFVNLIPVFTLIAGRIVLGDRMNLIQWGACAIVFAGVYLSEKRSGAH